MTDELFIVLVIEQLMKMTDESFVVGVWTSSSCESDCSSHTRAGLVSQPIHLVSFLAAIFDFESSVNASVYSVYLWSFQRFCNHCYRYCSTVASLFTSLSSALEVFRM